MGTGVKASGLSLLVVVSMVIGGLITAQVVDDGPGAVPTATASPEVAATSQPVSQTASDVGVPVGPSLSAFPDLPSLIEAVQDSVVVVELDSGSENGGGEGSGFVLDTDGHILTNFHVVDGASQIVVRLLDGSTAEATVIGSDPSSDLAVIRAPFDPDKLQPVTFGDSDAVRVGSSVFAVGNPFAKNFSVTSGIVSAVGRNTESSFTRRQILNVIQTDASLNPGNSGGPLFNDAGEVIGINSSITGPAGFRGSVGLGFAVPSNTALRFLPSMLAGQEVLHPQLGVSGQSLDEISAAQYGLDVVRGYLVRTANGAALAAGVQPGDVITSIGDRTIGSFEDLAAQIDSYDVGTEISLTVVRDGAELQIAATLQVWHD
ncbi:MAG: trypsin-like serine protease [Dehalococcoidia bacterium]|jgi:putative serine protease PepD|nr:trypsin-like serine protease [Dehalococcoidia bacterium]